MRSVCPPELKNGRGAWAWGPQRGGGSAQGIRRAMFGNQIFALLHRWDIQIKLSLVIALSLSGPHLKAFRQLERQKLLFAHRISIAFSSSSLHATLALVGACFAPRQSRESVLGLSWNLCCFLRVQCMLSAHVRSPVCISFLKIKPLLTKSTFFCSSLLPVFN